MENKVHSKVNLCYCAVVKMICCLFLTGSECQVCHCEVLDDRFNSRVEPVVLQAFTEVSTKCSGLYYNTRRVSRIPANLTSREHFRLDGSDKLTLWGGLTLSSVLWYLLPSCSLTMWAQYLQSLFAEILGMERLSRMSCVPHCLDPWEASYQFGTKDSCWRISSAEDQQESRSLLSSWREAEHFLPEWRTAHLPGVPNIKTAQSSWVLPHRGGIPTEEGRANW